jgi:predicted DNA-binding transcriptional regulator AlpA
VEKSEIMEWFDFVEARVKNDWSEAVLRAPRRTEKEAYKPMSFEETDIQHDPAYLLKQDEAAELLGLTPRGLAAWRYRGGGPPYVKLSRRVVRYRRIDLMEWAEQRLRSSTDSAQQDK